MERIVEKSLSEVFWDRLQQMNRHEEGNPQDPSRLNRPLERLARSKAYEIGEERTQGGLVYRKYSIAQLYS